MGHAFTLSHDPSVLRWSGIREEPPRPVLGFQERIQSSAAKPLGARVRVSRRDSIISGCRKGFVGSGGERDGPLRPWDSGWAGHHVADG